MIQIHYINNGRYCSSKDLHNILKLNSNQYSRDVRRWFNNTYPFQDQTELTKPVANYDYRLVFDVHSTSMSSIDNQLVIPKGKIGNFSADFMVRLELVKLIVLYGKSKVRDQLVKWLLSLEKKIDNHELVHPDLICGLLELAHLCTYMDNQMQYYKDHKQTWQVQAEGNQYYEFDRWHNAIFHIENAKGIKFQYKTIGRIGNLMTKREQITSLDPYKGIRMAIFDFLKVQYSNIDYFFPESTEKSLTLSNMTEQIMKAARKGEKPDIKPIGYKPTMQMDLYREEVNADVVAVSSMITRHIVESIN